MTLLSALVGIVLPVFLIVAAGWGAVRLRLFPGAGIDALMRFATHLVVPAFLFQAMYRLDLGAAIRLDHLVAFYGTSVAVFVLAGLLSRGLFGRRPGEAVSVGFAAMFGNSVFVGIPIIERAYGAAEMAATLGLIAFNALIFYTVGILAMETLHARGGGPVVALRRTVAAIVLNPLVIGLGLGLAANLAGLRLPGPIEDAVAIFAAAALPVALFSLGGALTRYRLRAEVGEALMVSLVTLIVLPALAWVVAGPLLGLGVAYVRAVVVLAAMPPGINCYIFAGMYDRAVGTAASAVLLGTLFSVVTIAGWLAFLGVAGM